MTDVSISFFMNMKAIRTSGTCSINLASSQSALDFNTTSKSLHAITGMPRYLGFAHYDGKHDQTGLVQIDAVALEYASTERQALEAAVEARGWNAMVFATERKDRNTVCVAIPFERPLSAHDDYTRAAALLARDLNVYNLLDGKANTFLVQPISSPRAAWFPGRQIDAMFLAQGDWVEIAEFQRPCPPIEPQANKALPKPGYRFDEFFDQFDAAADSLIVTANILKNAAIAARNLKGGLA